jgi:hypothetical protein
MPLQPDLGRKWARRTIVPGDRTRAIRTSRCHTRHPFLPCDGRNRTTISARLTSRGRRHAEMVVAGHLNGTMRPRPVSGVTGPWGHGLAGDFITGCASRSSTVAQTRQQPMCLDCSQSTWPRGTGTSGKSRIQLRILRVKREEQAASKAAGEPPDMIYSGCASCERGD